VHINISVSRNHNKTGPLRRINSITATEHPKIAQSREAIHPPQEGWRTKD